MHDVRRRGQRLAVGEDPVLADAMLDEVQCFRDGQVAIFVVVAVAADRQQHEISVCWLRLRGVPPQPGQHVTQLRDVDLPGEQHVDLANVVNFAGPRIGDRNLVARIIERILHPEELGVEHRVHLMPPLSDSAGR
jgi:hypothetical protein